MLFCTNYSNLVLIVFLSYYMPRFNMCIFNYTITFIVKFLKECHILKSSSIYSKLFFYYYLIIYLKLTNLQKYSIDICIKVARQVG